MVIQEYRRAFLRHLCDWLGRNLTGKAPWKLVDWNESVNPYLVVHIRSGNIVDANIASERLLKSKRINIIDKHYSKFLDISSYEKFRNVGDSSLGRTITVKDVRLLDIFGSIIPADVPISNLPGEDGNELRLAQIQVKKDRENTDDLLRLNWALSAYARSSPALLRKRTLEDLALEVCEAVVGNEVYVLAWVGLAENSPAKPVRPLAAAGAATAYLDGLSLSWSDQVSSGLGPTGLAIRTGRAQVMRDSAIDPIYALWRTRGLRFGIRSSVTVPIKVRDNVVGAILIYASQVNAFGDDELSVFSQLADELGFAISLEEDRAALQASEQARLQAEHLAREAQAELLRVSRVSSLGELAASIAHEINQPLAGVVTNSDASLRWLEMDPPNLAEAQKAIMRAARDANRSSEVIKRIRAFLAKDETEFTPFDLRELVEELLLLTQSEQSRAGLTIQTDFPKALPVVNGDRIQIQQVLLNLILNGIDALKPIAGRKPFLRISARLLETGFVSVSVAENGVGLAPGSVDRIFDHLFTTKIGGTGLGLTISRSIIEGHGGRLSVTPGSPHGAVFTFTVPIASP